MSQTVDRTVSTFARDAAAQVAARSTSSRLMDEVLQRTMETGFDPEAWYVMDQRDTRLIQDEIMGGPRSSKFVYDFSIAGAKVRGISVIGARELASYYGRIRHRLVSSTRKVGALFVFTTYPHEGITSSMQTVLLPELKNEPDGYEAVCEVEDVHTGNRMMAAKFQSQWEWIEGKREGEQGRHRENAHFATIAQSKAQRNAILMIVPQSIQLEWMEKMSDLGKNVVITSGVLEEKRDGVLRYGASQGIPIDRDVLGTLLLEQIMGLSEAARTKDKDTFLAAAIALRLVPLAPDQGVSAATATGSDGGAPTRGTRRRPPNAPADAKAPGQPPQDQRTPANPDAFRREVAQGLSQGQQTTAQTGQASTASPAAREPASDAQPAFEAWLVDADGVEQRAGEPMTDPVAFARAVAVLCMVQPVADILQINEGAIADACDASEEARRIIEAIPAQPQQEPQQSAGDAGAPQERHPVPVPRTPGGAIHVPNYERDCGAELARLATVAEVDAWVARNDAGYRDNLQARTKIDRLVRAAEYRILAPAASAPQPGSEEQPARTRRPVEQPPAAETQPVDRDAALVDGIEAEVRRTTSRNAMMAYQVSMAVASPKERFARTGRTDLVQRIDAAFAEWRAPS